MHALILVDLQNDFAPWGALPVPEGDRVIPVANRLMDRFELIIATQDWHPPDHGSFARNHPGKKPGDVIDLHGLRQILWPAHCVQDTPGAAFIDGLDLSRVAHIVRKGTDPTIDSYSGAYDNGHRKSTGLTEYLREKGVDEVTIMGLATDYCVKFTALDLLAEGLKVNVIREGCRGVNLQPNDSEKAIDEMRAAGATIQ